MKTFFQAALYLALSVASVQAQTGNDSSGQVGTTPSAVPKPTPNRIVDLGPNFRTWQHESYELGPDGQVRTHIHQFTELATGMYVQQNGQWVQSQELIEPYSTGAIAQSGAYQIIFANNVNSAGSVDMQLPSGQRVTSNILGFGYYDTSSGQAVLIAQVKDCNGALLSANQVIYQDAFDGAKADVRYTYRKGGMEQDVILRAQLPTPESFGLHSDTTMLEVLTEFINAPEATVTPRMDSDGTEVDEDISWGGTCIGHGKAFDLSGQTGGGGVYVQKKFVTSQGRTILIELVPLNAVSASLSQLPLQSSIDLAKPVLASSQEGIIPTARKAGEKSKPMKLAAGIPPAQGYMLDYVTLNSDATNFAFQGYTTYLISGDLNLSGITTIEGGTVIKYDTNTACSLNILGSVDCKTAPYVPAIMTSVDDGSVGEGTSSSAGAVTGTLAVHVQDDFREDLEMIFISDPDNNLIVDDEGMGGPAITSGNYQDYSFSAYCGESYHFQAYDSDYNEISGYFSPMMTSDTIEIGSDMSFNYSETGSSLCTAPTGPVVALSLANGGALHDVRISNVGTGIISDGDYSVTNAQFVNCGIAMQTENKTFYAGNILMSEVSTGFCGQTFIGKAEQLTYDQGTKVTADPLGAESGKSVTLVNSLLTAVGGYGVVTIITNHVTNLPSASGIYQVIGAGSHYLATNSPCHNAGTTGISPSLLAELAQRTTYVPKVYDGVTITNATVFNQSATRDDAGNPDVGYHYDSLDYVFGNTIAKSNLTFTTGTAVGWFYDSGGGTYGLALADRATASFNGTVAAPCHFVRYSMVQEGDNGNWTPQSYLGGMTGQLYTNAAPAIAAQFTTFSTPAAEAGPYRDNGALLVFNGRNCEFYGAAGGGYSVSVNLTNCLFVNAYLGVWDDYGTANLNVKNSTFFRGFVYAVGGGSTWPLSIASCAFDSTTFDITQGGGLTNGYYIDYNSFLLNSNITGFAGHHDITNSTGYNWQSSWLGNYYLPTNSLLIDKGNTNANLLGLYHFTTQTNQVQEANSTVDIGYHYVATDTNGIPLDNNGDGIPDYLEDANGDGLDAGETPWDLGIASQPQSIYVVQGQNAPFSVTPSGIGPFTYQWRSNSVSIAGATNINYTKLVVLPSDEANYSVVISNSQASVTSSIAALVVAAPLAITSQPAFQTAVQWTNVSFSVGISGNHPAFQWLMNGTPLNNGSRITGATNSTLTISNITGSDAASYAVTVTNLFGSVTSSSASLTVITNPWIASLPTYTTAVQSDDVSFSVTANGFDISYQWWLTNTLVTNSIPGATNNFYTKLVVVTNDAGHYSVIITNLAGATNANADLFVLVPPWITLQPATVVTNQGSNVTFSITAIGTTNLSCQWFKNRTNAVSGATNFSLILSNVQSSDAAGYSVLVTNVAGTNFSATAWLSVILTGGVGTTNGWGVGSNQPTNLPIVSMLSPTNAIWTNAAVFPYASISIRALASSPFSYITNVAFYFTGTNYGTNFMLAGTAVPGSDTKFALAWTNALPGTNILKARAWDYNGNTNDSPLVYVIMKVSPSISVEPVTNLVWTEGATGTNIMLFGSITNDGQPYSWVTNIQWSVTSGNGQYVTISNTNSLNPVVTFATNGTFWMQLQVDNGFATSAQTCIVNVKRRPNIYFNWPTNGLTVPLGTPLVLKVTATSASSFITNVTFYTNSAPLGTGIQSISSTYTYAWLNAPVWTNTVYAVATDNDGLTSSTNVTFVVVPPLAVWIVSPTNGQLFVTSPTNIVLLAEPVSYVGSAPENVVFTNVTQSASIGAGTLTNTEYQVIWQDVTNGSYVVSATARDNFGNVATNNVTFTLNTLPVVTINVPTNFEAFLEVTNVKLTATATDSDGTITNVQFFAYSVDPTNSLGNIATNIASAVCNVTWSNRNAGWYPVVAVATDNRGASSISPIAIFKVTPTNPPPVVQITYPYNNAIFADGSDITITAIAYGTNGGGTVTNVEFFVNGQSIGNDPDSPYEIAKCCWTPGNYILLARAIDSFGSSSISAPVNIVITNEATAGAGFWDQTFNLPPSDECGNSDGQLTFTDMGVESLIVQGSNLYCSAWEYEGSSQVWNWNGTNWFRWGAGTLDPDPCQSFPFSDLEEVALNGSTLYVAGSTASGYTVEFLDGTNWTPLEGTFDLQSPDGRGSDSPRLTPKIQFIGGDLYIYGDFVGIYTNEVENTNIQYLAKWDTLDSTWVQVGAPLSGPVWAATSLSGQLVIGGAFTNASGNVNANHIAKLVGNSWTNLGTGVVGMNYSYNHHDDSDPPIVDSAVFSLAVCGTNLFVGGDFSIAGGLNNANGIAIWNGFNWQTIGEGLQTAWDPLALEYSTENGYQNPIVYSIATRGDVIYVGGSFASAMNSTGDTVPLANIAKATWDEDTQEWTWSDLDYGLFDWFGNVPFGEVSSLSIMEGQSVGTYDLIAGGLFLYAGINATNYMSTGNDHYYYRLARWRVGFPQPPSAPTVAITNPPNFEVYSTNPTDILISATATSDSANITVVNFYVDDDLVGTGTPLGTNAFYYDWPSPLPGPHVLTAVATDANKLTGKSGFTLINILDTNNTLNAVDDEFTVMAGSPPITLNILTNDTTSPGRKLRVIQVYPVHASVGTAQVTFDGSAVIYRPNPGWYGTDLFLYSVTDGFSTNSAHITVKIREKPFIVFQNPNDGDSAGSSSNITVNGTTFGYDTVLTNITITLNGNLLQQFSPTNFNYQSNPTNFFFAFNQGAVSPQSSYAFFTNNWSTNVPGFYTFEAFATDLYGYTASSGTITVVVTNNFTATNLLVASITNLPITYSTMGTPILPVVQDGFFDLKGKAQDVIIGDAVAYQLLLHPVGQEDTVIANVTPQPTDSNGFHQGGDVAGDLGVCDFTTVPNGAYDLELIVHGGGSQTNCFASFQLQSNLKIGQFSFSEQDLVLPVNGIPLTVVRTYNSLNPLSSDFGYSWSFALNDMDVQLDDQREDVTVGTDTAPWDDDSTDSDLPKMVNIRTGGGWDVTLTLPDGRRVTFMFKPIGQDDTGDINATWWAPPGVVGYKLIPEIAESAELVSFPSLHWKVSDITLGNAPVENQDFPGWILVAPDGTKYHITRGTGRALVIQDPDNPGLPISVIAYGPPKLTSIEQRSGDTIVINTSGIYHQNTNGVITRFVPFNRDEQGRIIAIFDPNSDTNGPPTVQYVYNQDTGNLIQVLKLVDRNAGTYVTNRYDYNYTSFPHFITSVENGDGVPVAQNYYDDTGKLVASQDADGNLTRFIHSLTNDMDIVIDRLSHTNTYVYDTHGNITVKTNALGQVTTMAYDGNDNKTNEVVYLGNGQPYATNSYVYDQALNVMLSSTDPLGHTSTFMYDDYANMLTNIDARGNTNINNYDPWTGELASTSDALGHTTYNSYDNNNLLVGSTDALGNTTTNYYDSVANLISTAVLDVSGTIMSSNTFAYDLDGNRTNSTVWRRVGGIWTAATTIYVYDAMNRVVQTVNPDGGTNTVVYNLTGKQQETIDALGRTNSYSYDNQSRLTQTTYPDSTMETSAYDAAGNRTNSVDRIGRTNSYVYDALNRLEQTTYPDRTTNTTVYDGLGRVAQTLDARGTITAFAYDVAGRRLAVTNAFGIPGIQAVISYGYDANGNQVTFTDPNNHTTTNIFDPLNRQVQVQYPDGTTTGTAYDANGRRVAKTNQDNLVTSFGYDGAGRLISVTNVLNQVTCYQYDEAGNETAQIDALNRTNIYVYDNLGRRILHSMPGGQTEQFSYDLDGNTILYTNFNGMVTTNGYDVMNRLTNRGSVFGYNVSFTYNPTGQRTNMTDPSGMTSYSYDNRDRLQGKTVTWSGGPAIALSYGYDANGDVTNLVSNTSGGVNLAYGYDPLSRLTNVMANGSRAASYAFDLAGNLQAMRYGNGVTNLYQYDSLNRLTNAAWMLNASTLASFYYQLGLTGNRTNLTETNHGVNRTCQWQYDPLYRLTNEAISGLGGAGYGYDSVGNRTGRTSTIGQIPTASYSYNTNDWIKTDAYDSNGNTLWSTNGSVQGPYYYDVENHLTNANNSAILMKYDGDGNRVSKTVGSTTTYYLLDDRNPSGYVQVLEEWTSTGTPSLSNVYNCGLNLISQRQPNVSTNYFIYDGHSSTRMLTDAGGNFVNAFSYDAYGTLIASNAAPQTVYLYCGQQFDPDLGLYYNRARYLNTGTGRFWSSDSTDGDNEDPVSLHKYLYAQDNPVNRIDPSGHDDLIDFGINISFGPAISVLRGTVSAFNGPPTQIGSILDEFFSPFSEEKVWIMGADDNYTKIVRKWQPVIDAVNKAKAAFKADPQDWWANHNTTPGWVPGASATTDPHAWALRVSSPPGTDPDTAERYFEIWKASGAQADGLYTSAIGSFSIYCTLDNASTMRVWMFNLMDRHSFGRFAQYAPLSGMANQWMWWGWNENAFLF